MALIGKAQFDRDIKSTAGAGKDRIKENLTGAEDR